MAKFNIPGLNGLKSAPIWRRLLAFGIDVAALDLIVLSPFQKLLEDILPAKDYSAIQLHLTQNPNLTNTLTTVLFFAGIVMLLYFSILDYKANTIGKKLMKIKAVSETKELKYWQCLVRSMFVVPVFPFILLWIIDPLYVFFNPGQQRLLERLSKTKTEMV